tara:strand:+ start:1675 stop:2391 length:717 start_codon:yes stop_codon:yes gene_type:complete
MSLKKLFFKTKTTYKIYLYYNLYIRHKGYLKRKQYSQWGEDKFIVEFFKEKKNGVYLDIGCFNPFMYSNTCLLYKKGWSGINIDINPTSIDLFNIARPRDINLCTTINNKKKIFKIYQDDPFSPVNTLNEKFFKDLEIKFNKNNKILSVESKSIDEVMKICQTKKNIDFINIDVEGSDYQVLTQIKLDQLKPKLISIETHNPDGSESENCPNIQEFLKKNNFIIYKRVGPTTLFNFSG